MTALAFMSQDTAREQDGFRPLAKSAMERRQRDAGATFEERHGWLVPVSFPGETDRFDTTPATCRLAKSTQPVRAWRTQLTTKRAASTTLRP